MEYFQLTETSDLPEIGQYSPFKAVLAIEDSVSPARQSEISSWLVANGGIYAIICGSDCQSWEDSIRRANLAQVDIGNMKPEEFVMITTHPHERLRSVLWHAKKHAHHTHVKTDNVLTLHIGEQNRSVEYRAMFDKA